MSIGDYATLFGVDVLSRPSGELAAPLADKILKGTQAGTIPVVSSESVLQINLKVAQQIGITVPEGLMAQAYNIIR
jgi:ABC-type uncharacterized transport system substrate-binding protein